MHRGKEGPLGFGAGLMLGELSEAMTGGNRLVAPGRGRGVPYAFYPAARTHSSFPRQLARSSSRPQLCGTGGATGARPHAGRAELT